jgi:hypothetical protein
VAALKFAGGFKDEPKDGGTDIGYILKITDEVSRLVVDLGSDGLFEFRTGHGIEAS